MHSTSVEPNESIGIAIGGIVLNSCFVTVFVLIFTFVYAPFLLAPPALPGVVAWLGGLALLAGISDIVLYRLRLSLSSSLVLFILVQWLNLWGRIWFVTKTAPPFIFNPLPVLANHWPWLAVSTVLWWVVFICNRNLTLLRRIPKSFKDRNRIIYESLAEFKVDLTPWEKNWLDWRRLIILMLVITVLGFTIGVKSLPVSRETSNLLTGLLFFQVLLGFILITIGFYFYRRAFWKVEGLAPGSGFKAIWRRGLTLLLAVPVLIGLILPAGFTRLDQWWPSSLVHWINRILGNLFPERVRTAVPLINKLTHQYHLNNIQPNLLSRIIGLIFAVVLLVIFFIGFLGLLAIGTGYLLDKLKVLAGDIKKLKGLPGLLIKFYLFWNKLWRQWRTKPFFRGGSSSGDSSNQAGNAKNDPKRKTHSWGRGSQAIIRRGYFRLIEIARSRGFYWCPAQTPRDIASGLTELLPDAEASITEITADYRQARYDRQEPSPEKVRLFEKLRRVLQRRL